MWSFDVEGNCTFSQYKLDSGFAEYVRKYDKQSEFRSQAGALLQAALLAFICMEYISIGFAAEASFNGQPPSQLSSIGEVSQRTLLARPRLGQKPFTMEKRPSWSSGFSQ